MYASVGAVDNVEDEGGGRSEDYVSGLGALVAASLFSRCRFSSPVWPAKPLRALASLLLLPILNGAHSNRYTVVLVGATSCSLGSRGRRSGLGHWDWNWRLHNIPVIWREGEAESGHVCGDWIL